MKTIDKINRSAPHGYYVRFAATKAEKRMGKYVVTHGDGKHRRDTHCGSLAMVREIVHQ